MRILGETGLVVIEPTDWPVVVQILRRIGYVIRRGSCNAIHPSFYTPDGKKCIAHWMNDMELGYLDESVLIDLLENAA